MKCGVVGVALEQVDEELLDRVVDASGGDGGENEELLVFDVVRLAVEQEDGFVECVVVKPGHVERLGEVDARLQVVRVERDQPLVGCNRLGRLLIGEVELGQFGQVIAVGALHRAHRLEFGDAVGAGLLADDFDALEQVARPGVTGDAQFALGERLVSFLGPSFGQKCFG